MKARIIRYAEVEERFRDLVIELSRDSLDSTSIIEEGKAVAFALGVCIMQMKVPSSDTYPGKANVA